jgi:large subunit ribosomal protein L4
VLTEGQLNTRDVLVSDHVVFTQEALDGFVARTTGAAQPADAVAARPASRATAKQEDEQQ